MTAPARSTSDSDLVKVAYAHDQTLGAEGLGEAPRVGHHGQLHRAVGSEHVGLDVDLDDGRAGRDELPPARRPAGELRAGGDDDSHTRATTDRRSPPAG